MPGKPRTAHLSAHIRRFIGGVDVYARDHAVVVESNRRGHRLFVKALRLRIDHNAVSFAFVSLRHTVGGDVHRHDGACVGQQRRAQLFGRKGRKVLSCHAGFLIIRRDSRVDGRGSRAGGNRRARDGIDVGEAEFFGGHTGKLALERFALDFLAKARRFVVVQELNGFDRAFGVERHHDGHLAAVALCLRGNDVAAVVVRLINGRHALGRGFRRHLRKGVCRRQQSLPRGVCRFDGVFRDDGGRHIV